MMTQNLSYMETISSTIFAISLEASMLILAVLFVCWLLGKHLSARLRCSLWVLVWIKLSLPWLPESVTSIYGLWDAKPTVDGAIDFATSTNTSNSNSVPGDIVTRVDTESTFFPIDKSASNMNALEIGLPGEIPKKAKPISAPATKEGSYLSFAQITSLAWGLGVMSMGFVMLGNMLTLRRRVAALSYPLPAGLSEKFLQCLAMRGVSKKVSLRVTGAVDSPALYGLFRPVILLPKEVMDRYSEEELCLVWMHELEHLLRRDHWMNAWTSILLALHWFNPFVWYAVNRMRSDREFAVDEAVLRHSHADAEIYGESILKTVNRMSVKRIQPGLIGILESKKNLKERFERIAVFDGRRCEGKILCFVVGLILAISFLSHPIQSADVLQADKSVMQEKNPNDDEALSEALRVFRHRVDAFGRGPVISKAEEVEHRLREIVINEAHFVDKPFVVVLEWLTEKCRSKLDEPKEVHFLAVGSKDGSNSEQSRLNLTYMMQSKISIDPPMTNTTAWDVCQRISQEMNMPVTVLVKPYAILFSYDDSENRPIYERRTYKLPEANIIVHKAREILNISPDVEMSAPEALLKVFDAAGISFASLDEPSEEEEETFDQIISPIKVGQQVTIPPIQVTNSRGLFYGPNRGVLFVSAANHELDEIDRIVYTLVHVPTQILIRIRCGYLTQLVAKGAARHTLLRPLGKEILERPSARSSTSSQFLLSREEAANYMDSIKSIQSVEIISPMGVTTINRRQAAIGIALEEEENQAPQFFAPGPASIKVEVFPSVTEQTDMTRDMYIGLQAILPGLSREGQFVMFPDGSQFPEVHGALAIPKDHTFLIHYSRRQAKGDPWEKNKEEWLQEFVILVTPLLIDPAGNPIE